GAIQADLREDVVGGGAAECPLPRVEDIGAAHVVGVHQALGAEHVAVPDEEVQRGGDGGTLLAAGHSLLAVSEPHGGPPSAAAGAVSRPRTAASSVRVPPVTVSGPIRAPTVNSSPPTAISTTGAYSKGITFARRPIQTLYKEGRIRLTV